MLAEFHFLRPEWLWAVPAVIACTILLARRQLGPGSWQHVVDAALAPHVLSRSATRRADLHFICITFYIVYVSASFVFDAHDPRNLHIMNEIRFLHHFLSTLGASFILSTLLALSMSCTSYTICIYLYIYIYIYIHNI